jgi:hypothetical protein
VRLLGSAAILALLLVAGASAARAPRLFPLADGNRWALASVHSGTPREISLAREAGYLVLRGLPGARELRVRRVGQAVQAWDRREHRWEAFLRLGAAVGTTYAVDLSGMALWNQVQVTVTSRRAVVRDLADRVWRRCTRLAFRYRGALADAGLEELSFARGVGPVHFTETTIAGPRASALSWYRLRP